MDFESILGDILGPLGTILQQTAANSSKLQETTANSRKHQETAQKNR